jgi:hypothetical protein
MREAGYYWAKEKKTGVWEVVEFEPPEDDSHLGSWNFVGSDWSADVEEFEEKFILGPKIEPPQESK